MGAAWRGTAALLVALLFLRGSQSALQSGQRCPFPGVVYNLMLSDLPRGWVTTYDAPYSDHTSLYDIRPGGGERDMPDDYDCLLLGAKESAAHPGLYIAAFVDRWKFETQSHFWDNGVYWYRVPKLSAGFAGDSDIRLEPGDRGTFGGARRLSWHLEAERGGYRAGRVQGLDRNKAWRKIVMHGPAGAFCEQSICGTDEILKSQGLPKVCMERQCTPRDCCSQRAVCNPSDCVYPRVLKPSSLALCAGTTCEHSECCMRAPKCSPANCATGYILKPMGLSRDGCQAYKCTMTECCELAPRCPSWVCSGGFVLLRPRPNCSSEECSKAECCTLADRCAAGICSAGSALKKEDLPPYCAGSRCTEAECCEPQPPHINVSGGLFLDLDLDAGALGGNITWAPPAWDGSVTHFAIYLAEEKAGLGLQGNLSWQGNTSWGTNVLLLPAGTAVLPWVLVYTCNDVGAQALPHRFPARDVALEISGLAFADEDLDEGEIGGTLQWADNWLGAPSQTADICRLGAVLGVRGGGGGGSPAFSIGGQPLGRAAAEQGVSVVVLKEDLQSVAQFGLFYTASSSSEALALERFLVNLPMGTTILLAVAGEATRHLHQNAKDAISRYGTQELGTLGLGDSYALIGIKGAKACMAESITAASSGFAANAEISCPLVHFTVHLEGDGWSRLGAVPNSSSGLMVLPDTALHNYVQLAVYASSTLGGQTRPAVLPIIDEAANVSDLQFAPDDPSATDALDGVISWKATPDTAPITAFRVYISGENVSDPDRVQIGTDVPATQRSLYSLRVPTGLRRGNATHLSIFAVSSLAEQSAPATAATFGKATAGAVTVAVVATVSALGMVRVVSTVEAASAMTQSVAPDPSTLERCSTKLEFMKRKPTTILGTFTSKTDGNVKISGRGEPPQLRGILNPIFPGCVHHHHPCITVHHPQNKTKITLHRHAHNDNSWDSGDWILQKLSNRSIALHSSDGKKTILHRKPPRCERCLKGEMRIALRIYAPLVVLVGISAVVMGLEYWTAAFLLGATTIACFLCVYLASKMTGIPQLLRKIKNAPPARIRGRFWKVAELLVALLPCVPAFMSGTLVGWITGSLAILGALCKARNANSLAAIIEGVGGACMAGVCLWIKYSAESKDEEQGNAQLMAVFLSASLLCVKSVDGFTGDLWVLYLDDPLPHDQMLARSHEMTHAVGVDVCEALVLRAFSQAAMPRYMHGRLGGALLHTADQLLLGGRQLVRDVGEELYGRASGWRHLSRSLAGQLGRAIDMVSDDLGLSKLSQVSGIDELAQASGLNSGQDSLGGHFLVDTVLRVEVGPRLQQIEEALRELLNGPLQSKLLTSGRQSAKAMLEEHGRLNFMLGAFERCIGSPHMAAGHRACAAVAGVHAARIVSIAEEVAQEAASGQLTAADFCIVRHRIAEMRSLTVRVLDSLRAVMAKDAGDREGATQEARAAVDPLLLACSEALKWLEPHSSAVAPEADWAPPLWGLNLESLRERAADLARLQGRLCSLAPAPEEVSMHELPGAAAEVRDIAPKLKDPGRREAAQALCAARTAAGRIAGVASALEALTQAADAMCLLLESSRRECQYMLDTVTAARKDLLTLNVEELVKLKGRAMDFVTGSPVKALIILQGLNAEALEGAFKVLAREVEAPLSVELRVRSGK